LKFGKPLKKNHIKIIIKAINFKSIHKTIFLKLILFLHRFKLNDNLVYYGAFLNVSIKNSAASREDFSFSFLIFS